MKNLAQQLQEVKEGFIAQAPAEVVSLFDRKTAELADSGLAGTSLSVGQTAPEFTLPDVSGRQVSLKSILLKGPAVIAFYRGAWCPYCNLQLQALQQALPRIESFGAKLIAISPQTPDNSLLTSEKHGLKFSVLSDVGNKVAREYGLVFTLSEELRPVYKQFGIELPAYNGDQTFELPLPATFVINQTGTVRYAFVNVDYTQRAEPSDIINALKQL